MKPLTNHWWAFFFAAIFLFPAAACAAAAPPAPTPTPPRALAPAPVSATLRDTVISFAREHQSINQDWDKLHADIAQWRTGLKACDRSAGQASLNSFAGRGRDITVQARALPRAPVVRGISDQIVAAAELEDLTLRQLRDHWQPEDTELYERVDQDLAEVARNLGQASDDLNSAARLTDAAGRESVKEFSDALQSINAVWDRVHQDYDSYHTQQNSAALVTLNKLLVTLGDVTAAINDLPASRATADLVFRLAEAAGAEDQALRNLRNPKAKDSAQTEADWAVVRTNQVRLAVRQEVLDVINASAESQAAVTEFQKQYSALSVEWAKLNRDYDQWRRTEGGCDRAQVAQSLDGFVTRADTLRERANRLPTGDLLRAVREPAAEAISTESAALRSLRAVWRPFASDAFKSLEQEQDTASNLRRQSAAGLQDLLLRLSISAQEIQNSSK
ncbi:MAG: hypothetical protein FJ316_06615 [SAR202 cluster bacterium]|nr:hypothetical protein [SAR202 cluster bacterium]